MELLRRLVYRFYEGRLEAEVRRGAIPHHVGVLPDGNRRFARTSGQGDVGAGHRDGADNIERLIDWCDELGIPVITVWVLSTDNLHRPAPELDAIYEIVETRVEALAEQQRPAALPRRIRAVGRRDLLPASTVAAIERVESATAEHEAGDLIVAVGYGGRDEIVDAVRRLIEDHAGRGDSLEALAGGLDADELGRYLYAPDVPDVGRAAVVWVHAVAERVQRVLLLRGVLAGVPPHRLPARDPLVRPAPAPPRPLTPRRVVWGPGAPRGRLVASAGGVSSCRSRRRRRRAGRPACRGSRPSTRRRPAHDS